MHWYKVKKLRLNKDPQYGFLNPEPSITNRNGAWDPVIHPISKAFTPAIF